MFTLLKKEIQSIFNSFSGLLFSIIFLGLTGSLLWLIPGNYNIPENGYASASSFFSLAPILLMILIPALSMRSLAEEKKTDTLSLLLTRPVTATEIISAKFLALFLYGIILLLTTFIYIFTISYLALPKGNIDWGIVFSSYSGLLLITGCFICISLFSSSLTENQVVAFLTGLAVCTFFYFGFDLLAGLSLSGKMNFIVKNLGFIYHYELFKKGILNTESIYYLFFIASLFFLLILYILKRKKFRLTLSVILLLSGLVITALFKYEADISSDKTYSVSAATKKLLRQLPVPVTAEIYLAGDLNPGFYRLQQYGISLLNQYNKLADGKFLFTVTDPMKQENPEVYLEELEHKGIHRTIVNERNRKGKVIQQLVIPWMIIKAGGKEIAIPMLTNNPGKNGEENLNTSIELLEYQLSSAIYSLLNDKIRKIVFLEGHEELTEPAITSIYETLSYDYQIDSGTLTGTTGELDEYELVVIAGPQQPFSEAEKYILDQYLMYGGNILFVINGVKLDPELLAVNGETPSVVNEVNLNDMLFVYGARINPVLIEDIQSTEIPVTSAGSESGNSFIMVPWYFAPVLSVSQNHTITKGISAVKSEFTSSISFVGAEKNNQERNKVLLYSSGLSAVVQVPEMISLQEINRQPDPEYFNQSYLPVAVLMEGHFSSVFKNRPAPSNVNPDNKTFKQETENGKILIIASEEIIRNDFSRAGQEIKIWPTGYDRYMEIQFGNRDFIVNAINYLTDDSGLSLLRAKNIRLRLLDKNLFYKNDLVFILLCTILPPFLIILLFLIHKGIRKSKYKKSAG